MEREYHFRPGAEVFGSDGNKVGKISAVGHEYLVVEKGFFFPTDYYIPKSAVATQMEDEVYLSITKDQALNQGWDEPPTGETDTPVTEHYTTGAFSQNAFELEPVESNEVAATAEPVDDGDMSSIVGQGYRTSRTSQWPEEDDINRPKSSNR